VRIFDRSMLMKAHALLAAFILPVAIMFFVTGGLYTWGITGGYNTTVHELQLENPIQGELGMLVHVAKRELRKRNIGAPTGQPEIKKVGDSFKLEWSGSRMDVRIEPTLQPLVAQLEIKNASWYRQFVQLHKAKGGAPFKVYAAVLATALLLLLITGFMMAWQMPKLRKLTFMSTALGVAVFVAMMISS